MGGADATWKYTLIVVDKKITPPVALNRTDDRFEISDQKTRSGRLTKAE